MGDIELLSLRARIFYKMGDIENAVKHYQSALKCDPDNATVRSLYRKYKEIDEKKEGGNAAFKQGSFGPAIEMWSQAIQLDPSNSALVTKLYSNRATALFKLKRYEESIQDCGRTISMDSRFIKAYSRRAECYFALGGKENLEKCIRDYERIGELQSSNEDESGNVDVKSKLKQAKTALKRSSQKDLYSILGVGRNADEEEIRKAYRKMALKHHPDKQAGKSEEEKAQAEALFKGVGEAYEILSDPEKKTRYDEGMAL
jgi:DnaJ family protein C protein 7